MEKGATRLDKAAHRIMECYEECYEAMKEHPSNVAQTDGYIALYHEEGLYSVYNGEVCTLVYAKSPYKAIEKVMERKTVVNQTGGTNYNIQNCGTLIV